MHHPASTIPAVTAVRRNAAIGMLDREIAELLDKARRHPRHDYLAGLSQGRIGGMLAMALWSGLLSEAEYKTRNASVHETLYGQLTAPLAEAA